MLKYSLQRIGRSLITIVIIVAVVFSLLRLMPIEGYFENFDKLSEQQINHKLGGKLGEDVMIAHKTGEDSNLSNDIGIVFADQPFVICFTGHRTDVYPWEDLIRRGAYDLYQANSTEE